MSLPSCFTCLFLPARGGSPCRALYLVCCDRQLLAVLSLFRCVCPHLNSGLSLPSCGHPCAQDHKQAEVGEEGDQIPRGNSGSAGGLAAQVRPETPASFLHTKPLKLVAGATSAHNPACSIFSGCTLRPFSLWGTSLQAFLLSQRAAAAASQLLGCFLAIRRIDHH